MTKGSSAPSPTSSITKSSVGAVPFVMSSRSLFSSPCALAASVLLVAHRLSSLTEVDRTFVLDGGRLVEHGTHLELMERSGLYRTLFDEQMRRMAEA